MVTQHLRTIKALFFATRQRIREKLAADDCDDPNAWVRHEALYFIATHNGPTMRDVALFLHIRPSSATSLVGHLMRSGLVERKVDKKDKRVVRMFPSLRGRTVLKRYDARSLKAMGEVFSVLSKRKMEELIVLLETIQ